jgi:magnesium transporter
VRRPFVAFMGVTVVGILTLVAVGRWTHLGDEHIVVHIGVSSLLGGVTVVVAKALATFLRLTLQGESQFGNWLPLALVVVLATAIVTQLRYLNLAMARFGNSQVVPVYYVLFTVCAMTSGAIMYKGKLLGCRLRGRRVLSPLVK